MSLLIGKKFMIVINLKGQGWCLRWLLNFSKKCKISEECISSDWFRLNQCLINAGVSTPCIIGEKVGTPPLHGSEDIIWENPGLLRLRQLIKSLKNKNLSSPVDLVMRLHCCNLVVCCLMILIHWGRGRNTKSDVKICSDSEGMPRYLP